LCCCLIEIFFSEELILNILFLDSQIFFFLIVLSAFVWFVSTRQAVFICVVVLQSVLAVSAYAKIEGECQWVFVSSWLLPRFNLSWPTGYVLAVGRGLLVFSFRHS
jgi:hypothetical protein